MYVKGPILNMLNTHYTTVHHAVPVVLDVVPESRSQTHKFWVGLLHVLGRQLY